MGGQGRGLYRTWCVDCCLLDWRRYAHVGAAVEHRAPARGEAQWKNMWRWELREVKEGGGWVEPVWMVRDTQWSVRELTARERASQ